MGRRFRPIGLWTVTVAWVLALGLGLRELWVYDQTPGASNHVAASWPADAAITRDHDRPTLIMAVHPMCACSRASIAELARIVARTTGKLRVYVLAIIPEGVSREDWNKTPLLGQAAEIPGVQIFTDPGGVEATRFGAETSGLVSLFGKDGRLLFCGGITASRGHEGDNAGESAIIALAQDERPAIKQSPVFGCSLFADAPRAVTDTQARPLPKAGAQ